MHETFWPQGQELLGVEWQQFAEDTFKEPVITKAKHEGIKSSQPEASKKAYTPPHLRLMGEGKNPDKFMPQPQSTIPGLPPGNPRKFWHKKYDLDKPLMRPGSWRDQASSNNDISSTSGVGGIQKNSFNRGRNRYNPYNSQNRHY